MSSGIQCVEGTIVLKPSNHHIPNAYYRGASMVLPIVGGETLIATRLRSMA